jgi:rhamnosyl/mannosyltransferase
VPYGIDFTPFETAAATAAGVELKRASGRRLVIFAIGRHVYYKGFEFLVRAMRDVRDDATLVLGGTGPLSEPLKELASSLGLAGRIVFPGRIADDALPAYYHAADVFCLPSVEQSEAFGLVQIEAMACRKPVISCELGNGVSYVNRDGVTGLVVPPADPHALAIALNRLLDDGALRGRMGEAGYVRAKSEFTIEAMTRGMLSVYQAVLAGHS